ncbi:MAG: hypothetical protein U9N33_07620 [Campylobacterota bacterium]|nr:hypothetical protein [Campylobacterota bacterium]
MKWIYIIVLAFIFSGCDLFESKEDKATKIINEKIAFEKKIEESKEVQLEKLSAQTQRELAILESKKELANIEKEKELEKIRMQSELEKQRIVLAQEKEHAMFEQKMQLESQMNNMELKRYMMLLLGLFILLSCFFIFYYFKKRREDKLRAYEDNLQKYFNHKENEARVKIAEKMLDTIGSGTLDKAQENQLIGAFSGHVDSDGYQQQLIAEDIEIIEEKKTTT